MFKNMDDVTSRTLLRMYNDLMKIPSGKYRARVYHEVSASLNRNKASLWSLMMSPCVDGETKLDILAHARSHSNLRRENNLDMIDFYTNLRLVSDRLPEVVNNSLSWQLRVHGW